MAKFDPSQIQDPSTNQKKFETSDYIREMFACANC